MDARHWMLGCSCRRRKFAAREPFLAPTAATQAPRNAYDQALKDAGATLPKRDVTDQRVVREVQAGSGDIIKWIKEVGGWPDFPSPTVAHLVPGQ